MRKIVAIFVLFFVCGCMSPTMRLPSTTHLDMETLRRGLMKEKLKKQKETYKKIQTLYYPIKLNTGQELCDKKLTPDLGIGFRNFYKTGIWMFAPKAAKIELEDYKKIYKKKEGEVFVDFVISGSAADKAGIKEGDVITSFYDRDVPKGKDAAYEMQEILNDNYTEGLPISVGVRRGEEHLYFDIVPDMVCGYPLYIDQLDTNVNAYANGEEIIVTQALIDKSTNDTYLATIIAHELAHNTLGHSKAKTINIYSALGIGYVIDFFFGTNLTGNAVDYAAIAYSQEFEHEADAMSVYYMARAGYDYKKSKDVAKFLAIINYKSLYEKATTHPPAQYRYAVMSEVINEIELKKAFGDPIEPDFKKKNIFLREKR